MAELARLDKEMMEGMVRLELNIVQRGEGAEQVLSGKMVQREETQETVGQELQTQLQVLR